MNLHTCGGTILTGGGTNYCDRCHAFTRIQDEDGFGAVPTGMDEAANRAAFDNGEDESPGDVDLDATSEAAAEWAGLDEDVSGETMHKALTAMGSAYRSAVGVHGVAKSLAAVRRGGGQDAVDAVL